MLFVSDQGRLRRASLHGSNICCSSLPLITAGQVPPALAQIPSLLYMRLDNNQLSGSLKPYADVLARANATSSLLILDVSSNQLTGAVPAGLAAAPLLDPSTSAVGRGG